MRKIIVNILLTIIFLTQFSLVSKAQKLIYQEYFNGSIEFFSVDSRFGNIDLYLNHSNIDTLYRIFAIFNYETLIDTPSNFIQIYDKFKEVVINNNSFFINSDNKITQNYKAKKNHIIGENNYYKTYINLRLIDLTELLKNSLINELNINSESEFIYNEIFNDEDPNNYRYTFFSLLILYKNSNLKPVQISLYGNEFDADEIMIQNYKFQKQTQEFDIGYSIQYNHIMGSHDKSTIIYNQNDTLGDVSNQNSSECNVGNWAVSGQFKYRDGELLGFCDDVANETMDDVDLLVNLKNKVTSDEFYIQSVYTGASSNGEATNPIFHSLLTYVTDCELVDNQVSKDTALCISNNTVQLFATNGIAYEWEPKKGLSCYDCPNPVFNYDTSVYYTVKIWNADSCFKVFPVQVRVIHPPSPEIDASTAICGEANAGLIFNNLHPMFGPYQVDFNGVVSDKLVYQGLAADTYPYTITNAFGCSFSDTLEILQEPIIANFEYQLQEANVPFEATFTNTSQNAFNYIWIVESDTFYSENLTYTFSEVQTYPITLIAYLNSLECSDTLTQYVNGLEWFSIDIPNIFTPNGDGANDEFTFEASRIREAEWEIFNRWGSTLHKGDWKTEQFFFNETHIIPVWNGITQRNEPAPDGVYFYKITVKTLNNVFETFTGNVTVVR